MGKTVAVTGVNSYFASCVLPKLEAAPDIDRIIGIDITPWKGGYSKVDFYREDIRSSRIVDILEGVDVIFHLAFVVSEIQDKDSTEDININGSKNIFNACVKNNVKKIIYTSSMTVYGSHKDNVVGYTETSPIAKNEDSYYNSSKVEVENFVTRFFENHPDIILTVIRAGLLVGPNIDNMFSKLWSLKVTALPSGNISHNQFIHEEDLGEALYLSYEKDIPGIYNVTADDAVSTRWCFKTAGAMVLSIPEPLLKFIANLAFKLHLFPAGGGWVSVGRYTIFGLSNKFKLAAGWNPKYSSEEAFMTWIKSRERKLEDTPKQALLNWLYTTPPVTKVALKGLNGLLFVLSKIPVLRDQVPLLSPKMNTMTYLPGNRKIEPTGSFNISIEKNLGETKNEVLPQQILHDMIDKANHIVINDTCFCRSGFQCENFSHHIGCMFMGETALKFPPSLVRKVNKEEAHQHADKAISVGLVPMTGKVNVDNLGFLTPDTRELFSVCFCCHCCCMMGYYKHSKTQLKKLFKPIEGLTVSVNDNCAGCGECVDTCIFDAITVENNRSVHADHCVGCGRCQATCPNNAVTITLNNQNYVEDVKKRIESHVIIE